MSSSLYGPQALAADLRRLVALNPHTKAELMHWYGEAIEVKERIRTSPKVHGMPHSLWHFLDDADIRAKDPAYAREQLERLEAHLLILETGVLPPDDSRAVSFGDRPSRAWRWLFTRKDRKG